LSSRQRLQLTAVTFTSVANLPNHNLESENETTLVSCETCVLMLERAFCAEYIICAGTEGSTVRVSSR
jgi:hypothetical protein